MLAFEKQAAFLTVYSEWAVKQLEQLSVLLNQRYPVFVTALGISKRQELQ